MTVGRSGDQEVLGVRRVGRDAEFTERLRGDSQRSATE
jgi:hypothetical protein